MRSSIRSSGQCFSSASYERGGRGRGRGGNSNSRNPYNNSGSGMYQDAFRQRRGGRGGRFDGGRRNTGDNQYDENRSKDDYYPLKGTESYSSKTWGQQKSYNDNSYNNKSSERRTSRDGGNTPATFSKYNKNDTHNGSKYTRNNNVRNADDFFSYAAVDDDFDDEYGTDDGFYYDRKGGDEKYTRDNSYKRNTKSFSSSSSLSSLKDGWIADVVYGVSPVLAALEAGRRTVHTLYVQEGAEDGKRKDKSAVSTAMSLAKTLGAEVKYASKHDLNMVSDNRPHQGLILDATPLDFEPLDSMPDMSVYGSEYRVMPSNDDDDRENDDKSTSNKGAPVWLCLDEVMDPQNFGAALRSAFFLGASGVLTCKRNSAPLSGVVSKASAGALELMPVHSCRNLPQTLEDAKKRGWTVLGAAAQSDAISCSKYTTEGPTILVMGNEGYGLRTTVRQQCDAFLRIDGGKGYTQGGGIGDRAKRLSGMIDSLNVSVATGIIMHQLLAQSADKE